MLLGFGDWGDREVEVEVAEGMRAVRRVRARRRWWSMCCVVCDGIGDGFCLSLGIVDRWRPLVVQMPDGGLPDCI